MEQKPLIVLGGTFPAVDLNDDPAGEWPTGAGTMFFHAYCTGAIEKHMQDRGLRARTRRRASREAGE